MSCPSGDVLIRYADDSVDIGERAELEAHLAECTKCRNALALAGTQPVDAALTPTLAATASTAPRSPDVALPAKTSLGRYKIESVIGAGGMGVVYRAFDPKLGRAIALKVVRPVDDAAASDARARLIREARAMAKIAHPNVIVVHDTGDVDDEVFIAMELVAGSNLADWEKQRTRPWREIVGIYVQAARGLAAAHRVGLVHRDFKPHNALVGNDDRVRVLDFGIARTAEDTELPARASRPVVSRTSQPVLTETGAIMGSPMYMSPEQHEGERADARSDQFSFCVALYHALYGVQPFPGTSYFELRQAVTTGAPIAVPRSTPVPPEIGRALMRGLARDRGSRFPSMDELIDVLATAARPRRRRWVLATAGLLVAALGATTVILATHATAPPIIVRPDAGYAESRQQLTYVDSEIPALSADGHRLAYSSADGVVVRELATGKARTIVEPQAVTDLRWSPAGNRLCIARDGGPRIVSNDGESVREVALTGQACRCAWSPDGTRVAWRCVFDKAFHTINIETGDVREVSLPLPPTTHVMDLDWSRTGELAVATFSSKGELWLGDLDKATLERVAVETFIPSVRWNAGGTRLFYSRLNLQGASGEFVYRERALLAFAHVVLLQPHVELGSANAFSLSADEEDIYFGQQGLRSDVVQLTATGLVPITSDQQVKDALSVNHQGTEVVFAAGVSTGQQAYRQPLTGGSATPLPAPLAGYIRSMFSPSGDEVALISSASSSSRVQIVTLSTGAVRTLPENRALHFLFPGWTASGLVSQADERSGDRSYVVIDPTTGQVRGAPLALPAAVRLTAYTSDGTTAAGIDEQHRVIAVDLRDGSSRVISAATALVPFAWSDDAKWIYASEAPTGRDLRVRILAISAAGDGALRLIAIGRPGSDVRMLPNETAVQLTAEVQPTIWTASRHARPLVTTAAVTGSAPPVATTTPALTTLALEGSVGQAPAHWDVTGSPVLVATCGPHPLCLQLDGASSNAIKQRFDAAPYRGRRVTISFDARAEHSKIKAAAHSGLYTDTLMRSGRIEVADATWQHYTMIADIEPDATYIEISFGATDAGRGWIANLALGPD